MSGTRKPQPRFGPPPSLDDLAALAEQALAGIPQRLVRHIQNIAIAVEQRADDATLREMGIASPWGLAGLYHGTPLTERSVLDPSRQPDLIVLYRQAILLEWIETGEDLFRLVRNVVVHEVAHYFGFSDADIAALEQETE